MTVHNLLVFSLYVSISSRHEIHSVASCIMMKVIFLFLVLIVSVLGAPTSTLGRNRHKNGQRTPIQINSLDDWYASIRTRANLIADKLRRDLKKIKKVSSTELEDFLDFIDTIPRIPEEAGTAIFMEQQLVSKHAGKAKVEKCYYVPARLEFPCVKVLRVAASSQFYNI